MERASKEGRGDRTGPSANVPSMDGAVPARMQEGVARTYRTDRIEVTWAPRRCIHAGECFRNAAGGLRFARSPVVRPEAADPDLIEETVLLCPSGALGFRRLDDGSG